MSGTKAGFFQREDVETMAADAARGWLNYPPNKMSLPQNNQLADTDGDGQLDMKEFEALFDLDGDGNMSKHELEKAAKMFAMIDKDGDGQVTEEELKQVRQHVAKPQPADTELADRSLSRWQCVCVCSWRMRGMSRSRPAITRETKDFWDGLSG